MNLRKLILSRLNVKLFLSFLIIILVGVIVLIVAVEFVIPRAFQSHLAYMESFLINPPSTQPDLDHDLFDSFRSAVYESLLFAVPVAILSAVVISISFSRQFINPIKKMVLASKKISEGNYSERILIPENLGVDEMDELKQLAISFNQMTLQLEKTEELRRQLIGDVSHELRTPLSYIKASIEGVVDGVIPKSKETFDNIQEEVDRLQRIVDDLQELSLIESGAYRLTKRKSDVFSIISSVASNLSPQFSRKGVHLHVGPKKNIPDIPMDPDRIKQVLTNILGNALQFTLKNGSVSIECSAVGKHIEVAIKDTGVGISKKNLPLIFSRFFRVDKSRARKSGGSGIGLTIAKQLVEAHGGKIWAESAGENQGTTVTFTLPIP